MDGQTNGAATAISRQSSLARRNGLKMGWDIPIWPAGIICSTGCWNQIKVPAYKCLERIPIVTLCSAGPGLLFPWESETDENGCHGFARRSYLPSQVTDDYGLS